MRLDRGLRDGLVFAASPLAPDVALHGEDAGNIVQLLGNIFADAFELAATGAGGGDPCGDAAGVGTASSGRTAWVVRKAGNSRSIATKAGVLLTTTAPVCAREGIAVVARVSIS